MRIFRGEIFDPTDGITVFEKRFNEQHIWAMLSNKSIRLLKSVCGAANVIPRVLANNCHQASLADNGIADRHDPTWFFARAKWRSFFQGSRV